MSTRGFVRKKLREGCKTELRNLRGVGIREVIVDQKGRTIAVLPKHYLDCMAV